MKTSEPCFPAVSFNSPQLVVPQCLLELYLVFFGEKGFRHTEVKLKCSDFGSNQAMVLKFCRYTSFDMFV